MTKTVLISMDIRDLEFIIIGAVQAGIKKSKETFPDIQINPDLRKDYRKLKAKKQEVAHAE